MTLRNSSSDKNERNIKIKKTFLRGDKKNKKECGFQRRERKESKPRDSFSNILREDRRRRIWPLVLFCLICFLMTAAFELNLESYIAREWAYAKILSNVERLTRTGMMTSYLIVAGIGACLFGFQGFGWLMKKDQVDFYHSQPMKRGKRFKVIYLNGILMCLVPMFLHVAVYTLLIAIRGYLSKGVLLNILLNTGIFVIAFFVMYHLVILSVMLAGNILVSYMLSVIIFTYASVVKYLLEGFLGSYFETYVQEYTNAVSWVGYFSPVEQIYRTGNLFVRGFWDAITIQLVVLVVMAVLFLVAAIWLYKKRPSEAAGNALAFPFAGDFIRFIVVIPAGMMFGAMFAAVGVMSDIFWLYFGTIVGAVLAHGFMEVIFHFDIRAAIGKKVQLAASVILVLCIVNVFCFDIFGYDTYIPEAEQVEAVSYYINIGEYNSTYRVLSEDGSPLGVKWSDEEEQLGGGVTIEKAENSVSLSTSLSMVEVEAADNVYREDYQLKYSRTVDIDAVLDVVRAHMDRTPAEDEQGEKVQMLIRYEMKNGREVYRRYMLDKNVLIEQFEPIYNTEYGKKIIYPYWNLSGKDVQEVIVYTPFMSAKTMELTREEIAELAECYTRDIRKQSLEELLTVQYLGEVTFHYGKTAEGGNVSLSFNVAKHHENLLAFLEEKDIYLTLPNDNYEVVEVMVFNPYGAEDTMEHPFWKGLEQITVTGQQAEELIPIMVPDEYGYNGYKQEYFLSGTMTVKNKKTGAVQEVYCNIPASQTLKYMRLEQ